MHQGRESLLIFHVVPYWLNKILSALNGDIFSVLVGVLGMSSAQAAESGDVHLVANIFKPLSRPAQMLLEPTQLVLLVTLGIFLIVVGVLVFVLIQFRPCLDEPDSLKPGCYMPVLRG